MNSRDEQRDNIERVSARIAGVIIEFCTHRTRRGLFYAEELRDFVGQCVGATAPGSADRILRDLRQRGVINYRVLSRRESLYEVINVKERHAGATSI